MTVKGSTEPIIGEFDNDLRGVTEQHAAATGFSQFWNGASGPTSTLVCFVDADVPAQRRAATTRWAGR